MPSRSVKKLPDDSSRAKPGRKSGEGFVFLAKALARKYATDGGLTPLDVMIGNMRFWALQGDNYAHKIEGLIKASDTADDQTRDEARRLMNKFLAARQNAQDCAVDAAPYMHPRYQSVRVEGEEVPQEQIIEMLIPDTPAMEDRSYRERPVAVERNEQR